MRGPREMRSEPNRTHQHGKTVGQRDGLGVTFRDAEDRVRERDSRKPGEEALGSGGDCEIIELRDGWEESVDPRTGKIFFVNHKAKKWSWNHPGTGCASAVQVHRQCQDDSSLEPAESHQHDEAGGITPAIRGEEEQGRNTSSSGSGSSSLASSDDKGADLRPNLMEIHIKKLSEAVSKHIASMEDFGGDVMSDFSYVRPKTSPRIGSSGGISSSTTMMSRDEAVKIFRHIDANSDGNISQIEFIKALRKDAALAQRLGFPSQIRQEDRSRNVFALKYADIDSDESKTISLPEFLEYYTQPQESGGNGIQGHEKGDSSFHSKNANGRRLRNSAQTKSECEREPARTTGQLKEQESNEKVPEDFYVHDSSLHSCSPPPPDRSTGDSVSDIEVQVKLSPQGPVDSSTGEALASRAGRLISRDVSPAMAFVNKPIESKHPPPLYLGGDATCTGADTKWSRTEHDREVEKTEHDREVAQLKSEIRLIRSQSKDMNKANAEPWIRRAQMLDDEVKAFPGAFSHGSSVNSSRSPLKEVDISTIREAPYTELRRIVPENAGETYRQLEASQYYQAFTDKAEILACSFKEHAITIAKSSIATSSHVSSQQTVPQNPFVEWERAAFEARAIVEGSSASSVFDPRYSSKHSKHVKRLEGIVTKLLRAGSNLYAVASQGEVHERDRDNDANLKGQGAERDERFERARDAARQAIAQSEEVRGGHLQC